MREICEFKKNLDEGFEVKSHNKCMLKIGEKCEKPLHCSYYEPFNL